MRLVLALLMCCGVAFAQDTTKYFKSVDYGWNWQRGKFRGGLILPTDTVNNKLGIAQIGANCFAWSGLKWNPIGSTDTAFLVRYYRKNQVDSAIAANTPALNLQDVTDNGNTTTDTIIAASFKRTGGTSSQFLKANGSVDNNTYLTTAVTSIATTSPILGGTITSSGTISADTGRGNNQLATGGSLTKLKDSLATIIATKGTGSVTSVATGLGLSGGTITTSGTLIVDTANASILSRQRAAATFEPTIALNGTTKKYWTGYKTWGSFNDSVTSAISLTTTGTGAASYNNSTGVINVPTPSTSSVGAIDSIRLSNTGVLHTTTAAFTKVGTTGVVTQTLANQSAYTLFGRGASTGTPSFLNSIDSLWIPSLKSENYYNTKYFPLPGGAITGTAGSGFIGYPTQSTRPSNPSSGFRLFADSLGRFGWLGSNGFTRVFDGISNTANRTYTLPDATTTLAGLGVTQTFTGFNTFNPSISGNNSTGLFLTPTNTVTANGQLHYGLRVAQTISNSVGFTEQTRALDVSMGNTQLIFTNAANQAAYTTTNNEVNLIINRTASNGLTGLYFSNVGVNNWAGIRANYGSGAIQFGAFTTGGYFPSFMVNNAEAGRFSTNNNLLVGTTTDAAAADKIQANGNLNLITAGNKIKIATGTNASVGVSAAMTAGTITISTTAVTSSSRILLTHATLGGTQGILSVGTIVNATSFVINSSSATDIGTVNWFIIN